MPKIDYKLLLSLRIDVEIYNSMYNEYIKLDDASHDKKSALLQMDNFYKYLHDLYPATTLAAGLKDDSIPFEFLKNEFKKFGCKSLSAEAIHNFETEVYANLPSPPYLTEHLDKKYGLENFNELSVKELQLIRRQIQLDIAISQNIRDVCAKLKQEVPEDIQLYNGGEINYLNQMIAALTKEIGQRYVAPPVQSSRVADYVSLLSANNLVQILENIKGFSDKNISSEEIRDALLNIGELDESAKDLQESLKTYSFHLISSSPDIVIKITDSKSKEEVLMRIENRQENPRGYAESLAASVDSIASIHAKRQLLNEQVVADFVVTDYARNLQISIPQNLTDRYHAAIIYSKKMAQELIKIQDAGAIMVLPENAKWGLNLSNELQILDDNDLVPISKLGLITDDNVASYWNHYHAKILGRNLYQLITNCRKEYLSITESKYLDFSHPIFSTTEGKECKALIKSLLNPDPKDKQVLQRAYKTLDNELSEQLILLPELAKINPIEACKNYSGVEITEEDDINSIYWHCNKLIDELEKFQTVVKDKGLKNFLQSIDSRMHYGKENIEYTYQSLLNVKAILDTPQNKLIVETIKRFQSEGENENFSIGKKRKAKHIAKALGDIPIEERAKAFEDPLVQKELKSHRLPSFSKTSKSFEKLKTELSTLKDNEPSSLEQKGAGNFK